MTIKCNFVFLSLVTREKRFQRAQTIKYCQFQISNLMFFINLCTCPTILLSNRLKWLIKAFKIWQKPKGFFHYALSRKMMERPLKERLHWC